MLSLYHIRTLTKAQLLSAPGSKSAVLRRGPHYLKTVLVLRVTGVHKDVTAGAPGLTI